MNKLQILFSIVLVASTACWQEAKKDVNIHEFSPYAYTYSIEELHQKFSPSLMTMAKKDWGNLEKVNKNGIYKARLESLDKHLVPEWFRDAKLGIFYDWGLYSIAGYATKGWGRARYPDWYLYYMYHQYKDYHRKTWGDDFQRDDFIPFFTAKNFDAGQIADLVKMSGAKYIVPFNKHHDGYCLWDSKYTQRDVTDMLPGRDLTEELMTACKKAGIYCGFYFSVEEYEYPVIRENNELFIRYWTDLKVPEDAGMDEKTGEIIGPFISEKHNRMLSGKIPVTNFIDDYLIPQGKDFIDQYDPDILWFDGAWRRPSGYYKTPDLVAYFYNQSEGRKEVAVNDRMGMDTSEKHGDFFTSETDEVGARINHPWEECRSMSGSYGFNRLDSLKNYLTGGELIKMLVRIVAKGGNLNLVVNPDGTGKVPQVQVNLLKELGDWLRINGEAIYGTIPYEVTCDNTQLGQTVWYTMSKDSTYAYAIIFDWPRSETFICRNAVSIKPDSKLQLLGYDKPIAWSNSGRKHWGLSAKIPLEMMRDPEMRPCDHAWVLKFRNDKQH